MSTSTYVWEDRKRTLFGLPWSFTRYRLSEERLMVSTGLLTTREEELRLYRVMDISLRRTLREKLFGLGTVHLCTADKSSPELELRRVKRPVQLRDMLSELVEAERDRKRIVGREFLVGEDHADGFDGTHNI